MFGTIVCCNAVDDHKSCLVPGECNRKLVGQDVLLGLEVGGLDAKDVG